MEKSKLKTLMMRLTYAIQRNDPYIQYIKHPKLLLRSLLELDGIIGNDTVKEKTASQITYLIACKQREAEGKLGTDEIKLNTLLYGPPGVGKTMIGRKLAKIWYSLGFLDGSGNPANKSGFSETIGKMVGNDLGDGEDMTSSLLIIYIVVIVVSLLASFISATWSYASGLYRNVGLKWFLIITLILMITIGFIAIYWYWNNTTSSNNEKKAAQKEVLNQEVEEILEGTNIKESDIITIVSREDFIGQYVGWTDKKTKSLLQKNLGKVLFIDEAYSLINGPDDQFGFEALNTLTRFLSEHPGEIIVIMAGYKDLMELGPFSVQPGLMRRFMWHFDCAGYNAEELFQIFQHQMKASGWELENPRDIEDIIKENEDAFPAFGGDTEKLTFFSKLEHSDEFISNASRMASNKITPKHVEKGISTLRQNNIKKNKKEEVSENPMANMMRLFQGGLKQTA